MAFTSSISIRPRSAKRITLKKAPRWLLITAEIAVPVLLLAVWWLVSAGSTNTFFPPLQRILTRLGEMAQTPVFWSNVGLSVGNLLLAFVIACVLGVLIGAALGLIEWLAWFVEPVMHFVRAVPPVALVPIFVSLIGFGNETRLFTITLAAIFPVLISTMDGIRSVEPTLGMVGKVYRLGWGDRLFSVALPAAMPRIFSGMQVALIISFVVMIASEMLGSSNGLGAATILAQQSFAIADMWAGILVLGIVGWATTALFTLFRRRMLRWYIASQRQEKQA